MENQSYSSAGLFGQRGFGDYSGSYGGVPEPMTPQQIQQQLAKQQNQYGGDPRYYDLYNSLESSGFNANVNTRPAYEGNVPINSFVNPMPFSSVSNAINMSQQKVTPVEAINQVSVRNDSSSDLPPPTDGKMWTYNTSSGDYVLVDEPTDNSSQNARQTAPVSSAQQVAMPTPSSSSIVSGMFPEVEAMQRALYQQKQNEAMQAQAMQYARLDPMQQAQYSLYMGGQQLGGAIGGALGGKDPQLQMIGLQQQILKELDPSNPNQQLQIAQKYAQVAPDLAMKIADNARSSLVKIAQINRERKAAIGVPLQVSDRINELNQKMRMLPPDSVEYKDAEEEKARLMKPEKPEPRPSVGSDTERISLDKFGKNYYDLDQPQRAVVSKLVEEDAIKKAPKFQVDLNDKTAVAKASLDVMSKWEGFLKSSGDVENAVRYKGVLSSVALANAGNPSADSSLLYNIAKIYDNSGAVQEGDKKTIIGNPNIPTRFQLLVQGVLEGGSFTPKQREDLKNIATELVKNKQSQLNAYRKQYVKKNKEFGGDEMDILDPYAGVIKPPLTDFVNK